MKQHISDVGDKLGSHQYQHVTKRYDGSEATLISIKKIHLFLSNVAALLGWALLVDALLWNLSAWKPLQGGIYRGADDIKRGMENIFAES